SCCRRPSMLACQPRIGRSRSRKRCWVRRVTDVAKPDDDAAGAVSSTRAARGSDFVQSLERGLAVIRAFDETRPELTLSDVARATGLTRAAARRFLLTLIDLGYVRSDGR